MTIHTFLTSKTTPSVSAAVAVPNGGAFQVDCSASGVAVVVMRVQWDVASLGGSVKGPDTVFRMVNNESFALPIGAGANLNGHRVELVSLIGNVAVSVTG